jgi:hypothetical protein
MAAVIERIVQIAHGKTPGGPARQPHRAGLIIAAEYSRGEPESVVSVAFITQPVRSF